MRPRRWIIIDTLLLGVVGALSAQVFMFMLKEMQILFLNMIAGYFPPGLHSEGGVLKQVIGPHGLWLIPLVTTLGGFISGVLVYTWAPEAEGHGTDTAVKAFHRVGGFIRTRVAPLKTVASAITIGSGGSAGREGPTALISAGIGSIYATLLKRSAEERRLLVLIGMAGGLSAIFRSPIGTAIFAIEVLYGEMEFEASPLIYTMLGSLVAYVVNGLIVGWQPLFQVPEGMRVPHFIDYAWYLVPAALAISLSYLIQKILSTPFKYKSFYEGQVPFRVDFPAHYLENTSMALYLMCKPWVSDPNALRYQDLMYLLKSGVAESLSEGKQLTIGKLRSESPWVGRPLRSKYRKALGGGVKIIAILRRHEILLPHSNTLLQAGDQFLTIISPQGKERLERHVGPLSSRLT